MSSATAGPVISIFGFLAMLGAALNWRIVSRSGKLLNLALGNAVARVIYFIAGAVIFVLGLEQLLGTNWF